MNEKNVMTKTKKTFKNEFHEINFHQISKNSFSPSQDYRKCSSKKFYFEKQKNKKQKTKIVIWTKN